jgi:hypothetical protein
MNLLRVNIETLKKNTESFIDASKEVCLEVYVENAKYMLVYRQQNSGQNEDTEASRTTVTSQKFDSGGN